MIECRQFFPIAVLMCAHNLTNDIVQIHCIPSFEYKALFNVFNLRESEFVCHEMQARLSIRRASE